MLNKVIIYTDGSCLNNPGNGGYGAILRYGTKQKEIYGGQTEATNNQMELMGAIKALEQLKRPCQVEIYIDSQYVMNAYTKNWLEQWKKKNWKTAANKPVKNIELWQQLDALVVNHQVIWHYVPGHTGHRENERCDELAKSGAKKAGQIGDFFEVGEHTDIVSIDK